MPAGDDTRDTEGICRSAPGLSFSGESHPIGKIFTTTGRTFNIDGIDMLKLLTTVYHPVGWSSSADYELKADGKIYRTPHHGLGLENTPDYEFRGDKKLYRSGSHPDGPKEWPEYELFD